MRKIIYLLLLIPLFCISCSDNDEKIEATSLSLDKDKLEFSAAGESLTLTVTTTAKDYEVKVNASATQWCSTEEEGKTITVTAKKNTTTGIRTAIITVKAGNEEKTVQVTQLKPEEGGGNNNSTAKFTITGGTTTSEETASEDNGFINSFDGDMNTIWHTNWNQANGFPFTATYEIKGADRLDYIIYYPRTSGSNGLFGEIEIQAQTEDNANFVKIMDYDCGKKSTAATITLTTPVQKPKAIRFIIKSGQGGHASCAEMEFYKGKLENIEKGVRVPLGGNSYVTTAGSKGEVTNDGFSNWSDAQTVFSTFFRVNKVSDLDLYLKYRTDADNNKIAVKYKDKTFDVTLRKPTTRTDTIAFIGKIEQCETGYARLDFQGVTRNGNLFATPTDLFVDGITRDNMNMVDDPDMYYWGRRGPSVHMGYQIPSGTTAEWFYNEITVAEGQDVIGSYFMTNGFSQGYCGMQVNSATERRVLFSVWSPYETDDPSQIPEEDRVILIKKGEGVTINDFGNEGSGGQSYLIYPWKAGNTYKLLTRIRPIENNYSEYSAYFYAPETGKWRLIAIWKRPKIQTHYTGAHSFLENFNPAQGYLGRKVHFDNQWVYTTDSKWVELTKGTFTVDATGRPGWRMDYKGGVDASGFFLQNCGYFNDYVAPDLSFTRTAKGVEPTIVWTELE